MPAAIETEPDATIEEAELATTGVPAAEVAPPPTWPDETAESDFRSEARERGEAVVAAKVAVDVVEEADAGPLPPLEELVRRIPPNVRETLDDLFRVKFTTVRRVPVKSLKG